METGIFWGILIFLLVRKFESLLEEFVSQFQWKNKQERISLTFVSQSKLQLTSS